MKITLNGETVCYGSGSGQPQPGARSIVFVHGAGFDHSVWVMPARYFARHGFNVVAPDLPAHGASTGAPLTTIEAMADWLAQVIHATCDTQAIVVGHSMGTLVALQLATQYRQLVERLALLGTAVPMPVGPPLLNAAADSDHAAIEMANTWSHSPRGRLGASQSPGLHNLHSGERWLERMATGVYHADLDACNTFDLQPEIGACPCLVIIGDADQMTPARSGNSLVQSLQNTTTVVLPDCGHAMLSEQPNQVLDALAGFVNESTE